MAKINWWSSLQESAKAAEPYHGRLVAHYLLVIFSWMLAPILIGLVIPLYVLGDAVLLVDAISRKCRAAILFMVVASPFITLPVISIAFALVGYMNGSGAPQRPDLYILGADTAEMLHIQQLQLPTRSIDPITRRPWQITLCSKVPLYFVTGAPYNMALSTLSRAFGPMRGAYRGPYPSAEEARAILAENGSNWSDESLMQTSDVFKQDRQISTISGRRLLSAIGMLPPECSSLRHAPDNALTVAPLGSQCVIVSYAVRSDFAQNDLRIIELISTEQYKPFAWYVE